MTRTAAAPPASRHACSPFVVAVLALAIFAAATASAQPVFVSAVSRATHGAASFDFPLPQTGTGGIECRLPSTLTLVVNFDRPLQGTPLPTAAVIAGTATVGTVAVSGNSVLVPLTGVADAQAVTIRVQNITDTNGQTLAAQNVFFRVLAGDVNGNGALTASDVNVTKFRSTIDGGAVNYGSYRCDINCNGLITASDVNVIKARTATAATVAGGGSINTAPTVTPIANQSTPAGSPSITAPFTVGDAQTPVANLFVDATSSDQVIMPDANISVGGTGASRSINCTPPATAAGIVTITVTVSDGLTTASTSFTVTITGAEKLYTTTLRPENAGVATSGNGSATLTLSGDRSYATLRLTYANLTGPKTAAHIHLGDPGTSVPNNIVYDIDAATPQADGSFRWDIVQAGAYTVQNILDAFDAGRLYVNIHTTNYGGGELRGHFGLATGSQTFTPPPAAPAIDLSTANITDADAARFLTQATFGLQADGSMQFNPSTGRFDSATPSNHTIARVKAVGYDAWLTQQVNATQTSLRAELLARAQDAALAYTIDGNKVTETWWRIALTSDDQLRQRVAMALSEIFVVSRVDEAIDNQIIGLASYHDMLAGHAFGNFRTLLKDVTLHPIMGQYLNMRGNVRQTSASAPLPNENYAREILQLFSVGVNDLWLDGTLKLGTNGLPVPTYTQTNIEQFAKLFTGWRENPVDVVFPGYDSALVPPAVRADYYKSDYVNPMVVTHTTSTSGGNPISDGRNHDFTLKTLLQGSPVFKTIGATSPVPTGSAAATKANQELDQGLDNIFRHPNVAPFIARRLIQRLVTSSPSPGYIYRVSQVFENDGSGSATSRGNLGAVVRAILLDYEARSATNATTQGYGKVKEPLVRTAQVIRALHPYSTGVATGYTGTTFPYWRMQGTTTDFGQTPYAALTVFNFFMPDVSVPLLLKNSPSSPNPNETYTVSVNAPEMDIITENSSIYIPRMYKKGIIDAPLTVGAAGSGFNTQGSSTTDVRVDMTPEEALCPGTTSAVVTIADFDPLLNHLNKTLMAGRMPAEMKLQIATYLKNNIATGGSPAPTVTQVKQRRTRVAVYLVVTSPFFAVQR
ncbi:MAG TPA: DUF1800 family protein [Tepidisphaeraceae bacterium]|nr:DUF1800 family protein [Tepidisphaeraceae bacterium]